MSGPHAFHRTGSRPLVIGGTTIWRQPVSLTDWQSISRTLRPTRPPQWRNGKLAAFDCFYEVKPYQVLNFVDREVRPSKHKAGRMRPRTKAERARARRLQARLVQYSKTRTIDDNLTRAAYDEMAGTLA